MVRPKGAATLRERSPQYTFVVGKRTLERRLRKTSDQLRALRDELRVIDEQIVHLGDEADDLDTRALVSDYPGAGADSREARGHADAMAAHRRHVVAKIGELESRQDMLLDAFGAG